MLRGPQHDLAWGDEFAAWKYLKETFDNVMLGLRLGQHPRAVFTTTPKPLGLLRAIEGRSTTAVTLISTFENLANLAPTFREQILSAYKGTSIEREQLYGEILDEAPGALWKRSAFAEHRQPDRLEQVVVGVDPAVSSGEDSDETGIVVAGREDRVKTILPNGPYGMLAARAAAEIVSRHKNRSAAKFWFVQFEIRIGFAVRKVAPIVEQILPKSRSLDGL